MENYITQNSLQESYAGITAKKRQVNDIFILRFLKLQEKNKYTEQCTVTNEYDTVWLFCRSGEKDFTESKFYYHRLVLGVKLFSALPVFDGDWESI